MATPEDDGAAAAEGVGVAKPEDDGVATPEALSDAAIARTFQKSPRTALTPWFGTGLSPYSNLAQEPQDKS